MSDYPPNQQYADEYGEYDDNSDAPLIDRLTTRPETTELATRVRRLGASFIDGIPVTAVMMPVQILSGYNDRAVSGTASVAETLLMTLLWIVTYLVFHGYGLAKRGQSLGKMATKIQIVDADSGMLLPFFRVYVLRYLWTLPLGLVVILIPGTVDNLLMNLVVLVDILFIFRSDRRCLHDLIAGSKVVKYDPNRAAAVVDPRDARFEV